LPATREELARKRILNILKKHGIATSRTLEQKIADAGPTNQRINPHVLTPVRNQLVTEGEIIKITTQTPWYHLKDTPKAILDSRLAKQFPIHKQFGEIGSRIGQCLEIAIYRALLEQNELEYLGSFPDLDEHDDSTRYTKDEPPQFLSGKRLTGNQCL
jgi:hypothetical protein